jgi:UDP-glucose:(glucosyl)LPS alpha-1,2-glucosyltransferase
MQEFEGGFYFTEMQKKSNGGTEQTCKLIQSNVSADLLPDFQIIPSRVSEILENKIRIMHLHDLPFDPETNHLRDVSSRDRFHKLVFCGTWQWNQYHTHLGIPYDEKSVVIETPIVPIEYIDKPTDKVRLIYTSTPQRGLALLVPVFVELAKKNPNIHLDVFSSFAIYGWDQADDPYNKLFETCRDHPQITYHASQPNDVVREYLQKAHIFAYPSIWQECNSRALIEAMSAGCLCLHPNLAGLGDTSGGLTSMYQFIEEPNRHAAKFYHLLDNAVQVVHNQGAINYLRFVKQYADIRFNISKIASQWTDLMTSLKAEYPSVESRSLPKQMFRYKT